MKPFNIVPGSRWVALNSTPNWVIAHVQEIAVEKENARVYFTVEHRPGELLNCYVEAFVQRYTRAVE